MASFPGKVKDGVGTYEPTDWDDLRDFLDDRVDFDFMIWRGQRRESWDLDSTLDRLISRAKPHDSKVFASKHLHSFKYACRGRRGPTPKDLSEDEWWSLGQHFGLDTPLLDWTASPYVGLFFAFAKPTDSPTERRVLYGLKEHLVLKRLGEHKKKNSGFTGSLSVVRPQTDENPRLVNQNGLFTKVPLGTDPEKLVNVLFAGQNNAMLYKILIPDDERSKILKALNRMNINYLSLFPDLNGASLFCNLRSEIPKY